MATLAYFDAHTHVQRVGWRSHEKDANNETETKKTESALEVSGDDASAADDDDDNDNKPDAVSLTDGSNVNTANDKPLSSEILAAIRDGEAAGVVGFTCCATSPDDWPAVEMVDGGNGGSSSSATSSANASATASASSRDSAAASSSTSAPAAASASSGSICSPSNPPPPLVIPFLGVHPWWAHTVESVESDESNRLFRDNNPPHNAAKLERKKQFEEAQRRKKEIEGKKKEGKKDEDKEDKDGEVRADSGGSEGGKKKMEKMGLEAGPTETVKSAPSQGNKKNTETTSSSKTANWLHLLEQKLKSDPSIQVGEIGLDKPRKKVCPLEKQKEVFRAQLRLAGVYKRHIQVHAVGTGGAVLEELKKSGQLFGFPKSTVLHSYSSGPQLVRDFLRDVPDCYFSFQYSDLMSGDPAVKERYRKTGESSKKGVTVAM